ncbi:MAG: translation initiation factor IF-2 N-terminal domain-containing protein, partial [Planctomycetes bacterium]|nr:translation initiation factor IF-2 N-terminal domain-containing protein [Planctomycetota bacterium]
MAKRVFQLAKDLGVVSKDILDKCRAEGLELKNHMAALSAGLEATIVEWFSDSSATSHSAVEVAEAVDLAAARKKAAAERRRRKKQDQAEATETAVAPAETETAPAEAEQLPLGTVPAMAEGPEAVTAAIAAEVPSDLAPAAEAPEATPVAETADAIEPPPTARPAPASKAKPPRPAKNEDIKPAGPQVVPKPAQLQGPRVIRMERPDHVPLPQRRRPPKVDEPLVTDKAKVSAVESPRNQGEHETAEQQEKKPGRRSPRRRGGRSAESGEGIRQWRERDLSERQESLAAATAGGLRRRRASVHTPLDERVALRDGPCEIEEPITIKSFSSATGIKSAALLKTLMSQGKLATVNQTITAETAEMLALEHGLTLTIKRRKTLQQQLDERMAHRQT